MDENRCRSTVIRHSWYPLFKLEVKNEKKRGGVHLRLSQAKKIWVEGAIKKGCRLPSWNESSHIYLNFLYVLNILTK